MLINFYSQNVSLELFIINWDYITELFESKKISNLMIIYGKCSRVCDGFFPYFAVCLHLVDSVPMAFFTRHIFCMLMCLSYGCACNL